MKNENEKQNDKLLISFGKIVEAQEPTKRR